MSEIRFVDAAKRFAGSIDVIRDLNLHVREGEFMVLVGPSGCAKSTTLRMIAGLERVSSGELLIDGVRANELTPAARNISMVFQSYALFPNMTVRGNLSFGLKIRHTDSQTIAREVVRVASMLGLDDLLERKPRQLSGGQAQRVALGRAMIRRPSAFLFDEPLSNLDAELRVQMRGEIAEMQKRLGTTTVYVTHDQVEAMTMGDRIAVMNKGRIMQVGTPLELYERPANMFVAGFIGSPRMNLLSAETLFAEAGPSGNAPQESMIGVRPEHLVLDGGHDGTISAGKVKVTRIEDLGHEALLQLTTTRALELTARASGDVRNEIGVGQTVDIGVLANKLHVFDPNSGARLS